MKTCVFVALCLPLLASALLKPKGGKKPKILPWMTATIEDAENVEAKPSVAPFRPQFEILNTEMEVGHSKTVEVFWQRPDTKDVKGVFFGATGCFHQGGDFFVQKQEDGWEFDGCQKSKLTRCQGLPENVLSFDYARERGYLVVTITPQGPNSCWDHKRDPTRLNTAIKFVLKREGLSKDLPVFATGASQGGIFLFDLQSAQKGQPNILPNLKCLAPQCAAPKLKEQGSGLNFTNIHIPTMFIWMVKDYNLTNPVRKAMKMVKDHGVRVAERTPHPWKIQDIMVAHGKYSNETAKKMMNALYRAKGPSGHRFMAGNGFLHDHPGTDIWWKGPARKVIPEDEDSFLKDHSKFHHLMQAAYAEHEYTAEYTDHIIDFCEGHEDRNRILRFGREPIIMDPHSEALKCSPHCPQKHAPGPGEEGAALLQTNGNAVHGHKGKGKHKRKHHPMSDFDHRQKLELHKKK